MLLQTVSWLTRSVHKALPGAAMDWHGRRSMLLYPLRGNMHDHYQAAKDLQALSQTEQAPRWTCHHTPDLRRRSRVSDLPGKQRNTEASLLLGRDSALQAEDNYGVSSTFCVCHVLDILFLALSHAWFRRVIWCGLEAWKKSGMSPANEAVHLPRSR